MEEIRKGLKERCGGAKEQQRRPSQVGVLELNPIRILGTVRTKILSQITYQLHFGRSIYGWKDKRINFPMELVSYPNSF
jgi:hypothetical protein